MVVAGLAVAPQIAEIRLQKAYFAPQIAKTLQCGGIIAGGIGGDSAMAFAP